MTAVAISRTPATNDWYWAKSMTLSMSVSSSPPGTRSPAIRAPETLVMPPRYAQVDFQKNDYWRLRGKLDVPKERWISYPHCSTDGDPSLLVGWAGWDHLRQAEALVGYYDARKRESWDSRRLAPLLRPPGRLRSMAR